MNSRVPTGDAIFAEDTAAKIGSSGSAHFAVSAAKVTGAVDAKTKKKRNIVGPVGKGNGTKDAKAKKKLVVQPKPRGTNDAKTRKKIVLKPVGTNDAKTRKKPGLTKVPGASDLRIMRKRP